ncbi:MAG: zinc-ribbon domain-containing protein [Candidatus Binataceae bacterium]|nr:zinc-ribbon domain-containing protein [Candidatus Binataceae bacterium]
MTIEIQCTSCHTRYRIDEQVLPDGTPTFKCSRCGHVFTLEPRAARDAQPSTPRGEAVRPTPAPPAQSIGDGPRGASRPRVTPASAAAASAAPPAASPATPAGPRTPTADLLAQPFRADDEDAAGAGENLRFDFNDVTSGFDAHEPPPDHERAHNPLDRESFTPDSSTAHSLDENSFTDERATARDSGEWRVGEPEIDPGHEDFPASPDRSPPPNPARAAATDASPAARIRARAAAARKPKPAPDEFVDETAAPIYNHGVTHSSRIVIGVMALFAIAYALTTMLIRSAPASAADLLSRLPVVGDRFVMPITPARLVALRDVHADYLPTKGGHTGLVITGIAENVGQASLHTVQIAVALRDPTPRPLAIREVYCGNNLSAAMVAQMTPHELEFFQKLDPPKSFALEPSATAPFVIVFIDPPRAVSRFDVAIASAVPAPAPAAEMPGS